MLKACENLFVVISVKEIVNMLPAQLKNCQKSCLLFTLRSPKKESVCFTSRLGKEKIIN